MKSMSQNDQIIIENCQPNLIEKLSTSVTTENNNDKSPSLSKRQLKRLKRRQQWIDSKPERKQREKEKIRKRKAAMFELGKKIVSRNSIKSQLVKMAESVCRVCLVIDCDYVDFMNEQELNKLCKQINRCYAINRHSSRPAQMYLTSMNGKLKELMNQLQSGYVHWDVRCTDQHWSDIFSCDRIVYLSGDSPDSIPDLETIQQPQTDDNLYYIFIIGGLIDHNRHKGLALTRAKQFGVKHGQLPIGEHIRMVQRRILSIPHVFEIMLLASNGTHGSEWTEIFKTVIPIRKMERS